MKITLSVDCRPRMIATLSALISGLTVLYVMLSNDVVQAEAVELALITSYGQIMMFLVGSRA